MESKSGTVTIGGVTYDEVTIGDNIWTKQTLRSSNVEIPEEHDKDKWNKLTTFAFRSDRVNGEVVVTYNWYALEKLAPEGWHVPDIEELKTLGSLADSRTLWSSTVASNENQAMCYMVDSGEPVNTPKYSNIFVRLVKDK